MNKRSSITKLITILSISTILVVALLVSFGDVQTVRGQTIPCDPATGCPTDTPGPTCGLPGLPNCENDPPTDIPPTKTLYVRPTLTRTPTATLTETASPTTSFTPTTVPSATTVATATTVPSATLSASPTPRPWFPPFLVSKNHFSVPRPPPFMVSLSPRPNFEAVTVEITQAIQCLNNPNCADNAIQLFVGKPTMVRLYVRLSPGSPFFSVSGIGGELCPGVHDQGGCVDPVRSLNTVTVTKMKSTTDVSYFRGKIETTLNFILPADWTSGSFTAFINMNGEDYPLEINLNDNYLTRAFDELPSKRMDVMFVPVKSKGFLADLSERWALRDWLMLTYPTSNIQVWQMSGYINNTNTYDWGDKSGGCGDGWGDLLNDLAYYKGKNPQIFYAMVHANTLKGTPYGGCGRFSGGVAAGIVNTGSRAGPATAAQEIGHTMQRNHAPGCGAGNPDPNYPTPSATLDEYGLDVTRNQVYVPYLSFDFMGYCGGSNEKWVSMYTYGNISNHLPQGVYLPGNRGSLVALQPDLPGLGMTVPISFKLGGSGLQTVNLTSSQPIAVSDTIASSSFYLVGSGSINPKSVTMKRGFFLLGEDSFAPSPSGTGPYTIELLDIDGQVLSSLVFNTTEESNDEPGDVGSFHLVIPWVEGASGYQFKYNGTVIATQTAASQSPVLENITSTGNSHWPNTGIVTLTWKPVYSGSNPLQYLVQYSRDDGQTWSMLAVGLDQPTMDLEAATLAGSQNARLRIYVSDGFNTSAVVSDPFIVDAKSPVMHIGWTEDGAQIKAGQPVFLNGAAVDFQDGPITGSGLIWTVDGSPLGTGDTLTASTLDVGSHVIALTATNAEGLTGTTSIAVTILPADPKPKVIAELDPLYSLFLWAILLVLILIVLLAVIFILRRSRRRVR